MYSFLIVVVSPPICMQLYHENEKLRQEIKRLRKESSEIDQDRGFFDSKWGRERGEEREERGEKRWYMIKSGKLKFLWRREKSGKW